MRKNEDRAAIMSLKKKASTDATDDTTPELPLLETNAYELGLFNNSKIDGLAAPMQSYLKGLTRYEFNAMLAAMSV
jgi:hypothetical protein